MFTFRSLSRPLSFFMVLSLILSTLVAVPVAGAQDGQDAEEAPTTTTTAVDEPVEGEGTTSAAPTTTTTAAPALQPGSPNAIVNFVYLDLDGDGAREGGETGLAGVTVTLRDSSGDVVATKQTNVNGRYAFVRADGMVVGDNYTVSFNVSTNTTAIPGGFFNRDLTVSNTNVTAGRINHTPVTTPFDVALRLTLDPASINPSNRTATFQLNIVNQGQTIEDFQIINYLDYPNSGVWADFVRGLNPNSSAGGRSWSWNASNPQRPVLNVDGVLGTGQQINIPFVVRWSETLPSNTTALELWAEISNFDDGDNSTGDAASGALRDNDSTPDRNASNDNQPSGPGGSGDDSITGSGGDEDDHDVAGSGLFDLALTQSLSSGIDSVVPGSQVTFEVTVTNRGIVDATNVSVIDFLPDSGLRLVDDDWIQRTDGTVRFDFSGTISPGQSRSVDITFFVEGSVRGSISNTAQIFRASASSGGRTLSSVRDGNSGNQSASASVRIGFFDLAISTTVAGGFDVGSAPIGNAVVFNIEVINEGTVNATDISVIDYLPGAGMVLSDPDWIDNGNDTATLRTPIRGPIAPGRSVVVPITFLIDASATGTIYNWAEIAAADTDGVPETPAPTDVDSTPRNNRKYGANNSQLTTTTVDAPPVERLADPTEDEENAEGEDDAEDGEVQDNPNEAEESAASSEPITITTLTVSGEDDHDVAAVTIDEPQFDLSLQIEIDDDVEVDDLGIEDPVTFIVTVFNEGNVFVEGVEIVDYLPASGLALADNSWTDIGGGRATYEFQNWIAPGTAVEVEVDMVVTSGAVGTIVNAVEISDAVPVDFYGNTIRDEDGVRIADIDSVPIGDLAGNAPGTEDDHAAASITFEPPPVFDLAIFSDLSSGSERSLFAPGDQVTYDLTVLNQGEVITETITLETEVPEGFSLLGRDWEVNRGVATIVIDGPLAAGESETVEVIFRAESDASGNIDNEVRIVSSMSVDLAEGSLLGADGVQLIDVDPSDDQTTVGLSVIPTLAFRGTTTNWGVVFGWALLAMGMLAAMVWLRFGKHEEEHVARLVPATSRWG